MRVAETILMGLLFTTSIAALPSAQSISTGPVPSLGTEPSNNAALVSDVNPCDKIEPNIQSISQLVDAIRTSTNATTISCLQMRLYEKTPKNDGELKLIFSVLDDNRLAPYAEQGIYRIKDPKMGNLLYRAFARYWRRADFAHIDAGAPCDGLDLRLCALSQALGNIHYNPDASALKKFHQYLDGLNDQLREENLSGLDDWIAEARQSLSGDACQSNMENFDTNGIEDNPRLIDTYIYIVQKSTDTACLSGFIGGLNGSIVSSSGKRLKAQPKQWEKIASALISVMNNSNINHWHGHWSTMAVKGWRVRYEAATTLEHMGPPYQEAAYQFFLNELGRMSKGPNVNDQVRQEAIELIEKFYFNYPHDAIYGFYQEVKHAPPVALFRAINKNLDLLDFWRSESGRYGNNYKKITDGQISKFELLLKTN